MKALQDAIAMKDPIHLYSVVVSSRCSGIIWLWNYQFYTIRCKVYLLAFNCNDKFPSTSQGSSKHFSPSSSLPFINSTVNLTRIIFNPTSLFNSKLFILCSNYLKLNTLYPHLIIL